MFAEEGEGVECGHGSSRASGGKMGVILTSGKSKMGG